MPLQAPVAIEADEQGNVCAIVTRPQQIGPVGKDGRPRPVNAGLPDLHTPCDSVVVAIGQGIDSKTFEEAGIPTVRGAISALPDSFVKEKSKVFAGGDAVTGAATVILAMGAGKRAAAAMDEYVQNKNK